MVRRIASPLMAAAIAGACLCATPAWAQSPGNAAGRGAADLDEIVITGSRIKRTGADTPMPTSIIDVDAIERAGATTLAELVNQVPSLFITQTAQTANQEGNAGIESLDLRGMGTERTLALVNGRRRVAAMPGTSAIDIATIPTGLVERVEVITGGASALYGADAVAGVVNFKLRDDFQGLQANGSYSGSTRGDLDGYDLDILAGRNFADDRGNVTFFAAYSDHPDTVAGQDRPWTASGTPLYVLGSDGIRHLTDGNRSIYDHQEAIVELGGRGNLYTFTADGALRQPELGPGGITNIANTSSNLSSYLTDGGEFLGRYDDWLLQVPTEKLSLYGTSKFAITDRVKVFGDLAWAQTDSRSEYRAWSAYGFDFVPGDSPFITPEMIAANGAPIGSLGFTRRYTELGRGQTTYDRSMVQGTAGFEGEYGESWSWSAYYSYGKTRQDVTSVNATASDRYYLALDSTDDGAGNAICRSTLTDPGNGCVALNPFRTLTQDVIDYLQFDSSPARQELTQQVFSAYTTGDLFSLPAGAVQAVLGAEYRKESNDIGATPEFDPESPSFDPSLGTSEVALVGEYNVKEVFGELRIPIFKDITGLKELSVEGAVRLSDYSTAGETTAYKAALAWSPVQGVRFRGTYGQAVRAPNINELFTSTRISGAWLSDPCNYWDVVNRPSRSEYTAANCAAIAPANSATYWQWRDVIASGNSALDVETAKTYTAGVVLQPEFARGLTFTVDYFDIDLEDAIDSFGAQLIMEKCVDAPTLDNQFCGFVARDANNNLVSVETKELNLARYTTRGIDFEVNYAAPIGPGTLSVNAAATKLLERSFILDMDDPNSIEDTVGQFGSPEWKGAMRTAWSQGPLVFNWTLRYYSRMRPGSGVTAETHDIVYTDEVMYHDFYVGYSLTNSVSLYGGLSNAFDEAPPRLPGAEAGGANFEWGYQSGVYDVIGRTFYLGARFTP